MARRAFEWSPMGKRFTRRSRNRLREGLEGYYGTECANWTNMVMDRSAWHDLVESSKTDRGL